MAAGDVEVNLNNPLGRRCACFDGVDDKVTLSATSPLQEIGKNKIFTVSAWINTGYVVVDATEQAILSSTSASDNRFSFILISGRARAAIYNGSAYIAKASSSDIIPVNTWIHLIYTWDTSTAKLYQNGVLQTETTNGGAGVNAGSYIGGGTAGGRFFQGGISDVQVWNRILTSDEIQEVYNGKIITNGLKHRWKLSEDYTDSVGSANGTNTGSILAVIDDQVSQAVATDRTTANDQYLITTVNNKVMTAIIEEAP